MDAGAVAQLRKQDARVMLASGGFGLRPVVQSLRVSITSAVFYAGVKTRACWETCSLLRKLEVVKGAIFG